MTESFAELFEQSQSISKLRSGAIVSGIVVEIRSDVVVVNAGLKSEGIIPIEQFRNERGELEINVGDEVEVFVDRVENANGEAISLWQALLRFMVSIASWLCLGLGFFWSLFDKQKRAWHDIYSDTQLVRIPKKAK